MSDKINPALYNLAERQVWEDAGGKYIEKVAVVPAGGGAPPMDPAMAGGMPPGAAPPMDPAMAGGAPPMDPAMAGGMPPMDPAMAGGMPMDPMAQMGAAAGGVGQKLKPEQMMQMLDFRLYNMQQQLTAIMNAQGIDLPPGALVTPPGSPTPVAEAAVPGGPQDPGPATGGQGGGTSAIGAIDPIQGASPELAMGGGGEKIGQANSLTWDDFTSKEAEGKANTRSTAGDVDEEGPRHSSAPADLPGGHPGKRPATQSITAGGSKDPKSVTAGPMPKAAAFGNVMGRGDLPSAQETLNQTSPAQNATAIAALLRRHTAQ